MAARDALCIGVNANFNFQSCVLVDAVGGCFQRDADQMAIELLRSIALPCIEDGDRSHRIAQIKA